MPLWENSLYVFISTANHLTIYNFKVHIFIIYPVILEKKSKKSLILYKKKSKKSNDGKYNCIKHCQDNHNIFYTN